MLFPDWSSVNAKNLTPSAITTINKDAFVVATSGIESNNFMINGVAFSGTTFELGTVTFFVASGTTIRNLGDQNVNLKIYSLVKSGGG